MGSGYFSACRIERIVISWHAASAESEYRTERLNGARDYAMAYRLASLFHSAVWWRTNQSRTRMDTAEFTVLVERHDHASYSDLLYACRSHDRKMEQSVCFCFCFAVDSIVKFPADEYHWPWFTGDNFGISQFNVGVTLLLHKQCSLYHYCHPNWLNSHG